MLSNVDSPHPSLDVSPRLSGSSHQRRSIRPRRSRHVRFAPKADKRTLASVCPLSAKRAHDAITCANPDARDGRLETHAQSRIVSSLDQLVGEIASTRVFEE